MGGLQTRRRHLIAVMFVSQGAGLVVAAAVALATGAQLTATGAAWGAAASIAGVLSLACFYKGLAIGTMSIVAPITAMAAIVPVIVGLAEGERPSALQGVGMAVAVIGIVLASREEVAGERSSSGSAAILLAAGAALGFGLFFVGLDRAADAADPLAVVAVARLVSTVPLAILFAVVRPGLGGPAAPLLLIGVLDVAANALFALATAEGLLSVVSVLGSLYPAVTVVCARVVLRERVTRVQEGGVVLALVGVVAISAG